MKKRREKEAGDEELAALRGERSNQSDCAQSIPRYNHKKTVNCLSLAAFLSFFNNLRNFESYEHIQAVSAKFQDFK